MGAGHTHPLYVHEHSPVHDLSAEVKAAAAFAFVVVVATTPRTAVVAFAVHAVLVVAVARVARVPGRFVLPRLLVVAPFALFAVLLPFVAGGPTVEVAGIPLSESGLWGAFNVVAKSVLGAATSVLLAATTEVPDLLRGLERLRVPAVLTTIAAFMVRYLEVVAGELRRTRTAMAARGYDPRWLWQLRPLAASAGALFVRSYERGERVHTAMLARGFSGTMPDLGHTGATPGQWLGGALLPAAALAATLSVRVVG